MQLINSDIAMLPAAEIVRNLNSRFATDENSAAMSSHWKIYSAQSHAKFNSSGRLTKLKGSGFGDYAVRPWIMGFGILNYATYLPTLALPVGSRAHSLKAQLNFLRALGVSLFPYDSLRHAALAAFLTSHPASRQTFEMETPRICLIGDGWGLLSALIKKSCPRAQITIVDLGKTLTFSSLFLQDRFPKCRFNLVKPDEPNRLDSDFNFIVAEDIARLNFPENCFDFAINVASMQEMDQTWIDFYFGWLRKHLQPDGQFYCCNRELKTLPDGSQAIFANYPWQSEDRIYFDGEPTFYRWFFSFQKTARNVRRFGFKIPFMRLFDGVVRHRLVQLQKK
jgi:hypothetical protein